MTCNHHPLGAPTGLTCTGEGHPFGHTFISTGGGADAEAGGDSDD